MKKLGFLNKVVKEGKLNIVEPSNEICSSYLEKSENCLKSGKILLKNSLHENSVSMFYYSMYNSVLALLFKVGVKSENHLASILLIKELFEREDLFKIISFAKKERIDKQYYVSLENFLTKESAFELLKESEKFLIHIKLLINNLKGEDIKKLRNKFNLLLKER